MHSTGESKRISIRLNGEQRAVEAGETIAQLVSSLGFQAAEVAVECNRRLVPRADHGDVQLADGDAIEVVTLVGGG